jgi:hypothetical protein
MLAYNIVEKQGVIGKNWTINPKTKKFGSPYLYKAKHMKCLESMGITDVKDYIFEDLSKINFAPLTETGSPKFCDNIASLSIWDLHVMSLDAPTMNEEFATSTKKVAKSIVEVSGIYWSNIRDLVS